MHSTLSIDISRSAVTIKNTFLSLQMVSSKAHSSSIYGRLSAGVRNPPAEGRREEASADSASVHKMARLDRRTATIKGVAKDSSPGRLGAVIGSKNIKVTPRSLRL